MIRLFVALKIPNEALDRLLNECYNALENQMKYKLEKKEKIHLTLKFIGEVKDNLVEPISSELEFVKDYSSFKCSISKFGFFFRNQEPKILWSDLQSDQPFNPLVDELNKRMKIFGVEAEKRKFIAHLTLMRIKQKVSDKFVEKMNLHKFEQIDFIADKIALIRSQLSQVGASYKDLKTYELK